MTSLYTVVAVFQVTIVEDFSTVDDRLNQGIPCYRLSHSSLRNVEYTLHSIVQRQSGNDVLSQTL
jgi:hypothetical protein